ncbi:MAG: hypothetical protein R3C61_12875 [Bacteroidia bacterium]
MDKNVNVSKAQLEVWEWKEKAVSAFDELPLDEKLLAIMKRATQTTDRYIAEGKLRLLTRARRVRQSR